MTALSTEPGGGAGPDETPSAALVVGDSSRDEVEPYEAEVGERQP